jgi:homoserine O-acetyltransferase/O-succinyltransferase
MLAASFLVTVASARPPMTAPVTTEGNDPKSNDSDYTTDPPQGLRIALDFLVIAGSAPQPMQKSMPTRDDADRYLDRYFRDRIGGLDANDFLCEVNASRNYDPSPQLETIEAPVM